MSSSEEETKIDMLDSSEEVARKVNKAFCQEGNVDRNPVLAFCEHVLFSVFQSGFDVERTQEHGGKVSYRTYEELKEAFGKMELHPADLKKAVATYLNKLMEPVRKEFESPELKELVARAYPPEETKKGGLAKKVEKMKV